MTDVTYSFHIINECLHKNSPALAEIVNIFTIKSMIYQEETATKNHEELHYNSEKNLATMMPSPS